MIKRFTLVELLVVISIIALLASLMLPALGQARKQGYLAACVGNQRQIGLAFAGYANDFNEWMPPLYASLYGSSRDLRSVFAYPNAFGIGILIRERYLGAVHDPNGAPYNKGRPKTVQCPENSSGGFQWNNCLDWISYCYARDSGNTPSGAYYQPFFEKPYGRMRREVLTWCLAARLNLDEGSHHNGGSTFLRADGSSSFLKYHSYNRFRSGGDRSQALIALDNQ